jgi:glycosyltransferase involved in cell wall biosynthesis
MKQEPRYVWLGELQRLNALATLGRARAMLISSRMEGGANVVSEALMARVPVIASRIPGNVGMLGADYAGYYPVGNARALARLLQRLEKDGDFLKTLRRQCAERRKLISHSQERKKLRALITECSNNIK